MQRLPGKDTRPGLLPWQILFVFFLLGLLALAKPFAALCSACAFFGLQKRLIPGPGPGLLQAGALFCLGWLVQFWVYPGPEVPVTEWMQQRQKVKIEARILQVEPKQNARLQIILDKVRYTTPEGNQGQLPSRLLWNWYEPPQNWPAPGQKVSGQFRLKPIKGFANPGVKDSRFYWRGKQVKYRTYTSGEAESLSLKEEPGFLWQLRQGLRDKILEQSPAKGPGQGVLLALLMGDRTHLDPGTMDLIRRSSLAHSLALSGLHLGFLVGMGWGLAWLWGRIKPGIYLYLPRPKLAVFISAPLILIYIWLGQAKLSLLRAALMFFFWGLLLLLGRNKKLLDGLFFAVLLIVMLDPAAVFDLSLQLSVLAVAGIVLAWPLFSQHLQGWKNKGPAGKILFSLLSILAITLVANAALAPALAAYFGEISPHVYLNLFWLPLLGWVVLPLGLLALACSQLPGLEIFSPVLFTAATQLLNFMLSMLQALQEQGFLQPLVLLRPIWPALLGYWIMLSLVLLCCRGKWTIPWKTACLALLLLLLPPVLQEWQLAREHLKLQLLDVGQGQAIHIQAPKGRRLLLDGGGSWNPDFNLGRYALAPALSMNQAPRLNRILLSHGHYDHLRGLFYPLRHFRVQKFLYNGHWPQGRDKQILQDILEDREISRQVLQQGQSLELGSGLRLEVLHPPQDWSNQDPNHRSLVLRLTHKGQGLALLPGDIGQAGLQELLQSHGLDLKAQILVLPHHGSRKSLNREFLRRVDPDLALVSCGYLHHFNLPHQEVKQALQEMSVPLYSTARHGTLQVQWSLGPNEPQLETWLED
ncbi:MAG: DNA internalization-related competence protein ComEC/Rec2 [Thermodesulfobacteriota bacterium]